MDPLNVAPCLTHKRIKLAKSGIFRLEEGIENLRELSILGIDNSNIKVWK